MQNDNSIRVSNDDPHSWASLVDLFKPDPEASKLPKGRTDPLIWQDTARVPKAGEIVPCLLCSKPMIMPMYLGKPPDQICPECQNTYKELATLVCGRCKTTIARIIPKKMDNGYTVKRREVLHTDTCGCCAPNKQISYIKEIAHWERTARPGKPIVTMHGIPTVDLKSNPFEDMKKPKWEGIIIEPAKRVKNRD